ncbi:MAG: transglutaminase family protein [Dokdonella sp.]
MPRYFAWIMALFGFASACAGDAPARSNDEMEQAIRALLVVSPYKISEAARAGTIRYRVRLREGPVWNWPETAEQHVAQDGDATELTICEDCGREPPPDKAELQRYLQPNDWVQSRDRRVKDFARVATAGSIDAKMSALILAIQKHMNGAIDFREYQSAVQALDSRGGDCTEYAVLLAAAARARGIPTRVVSGISYASQFLGERHAFSPHMWVQVWNGTRWASYDAALGHFDAGHIAIAIGDGSPDSLRGTMATIARMKILDAAGVLPAREDTSH